MALHCILLAGSIGFKFQLALYSDLLLLDLSKYFAHINFTWSVFIISDIKFLVSNDKHISGDNDHVDFNTRSSI